MTARQSIGPWKRDESVAVCDGCQEPFSVMRRRHHCRCCGCVFCYHCCNHRALIPELDPVEPQRVCTVCNAMLRSRPSQAARRNHPAGHANDMTYTCSRAAAPSFPTPAAGNEVHANLGAGRAASSSVEESEDDDSSNDSADEGFDDSDEVDVSSAVAGVLSSWDERKTNNISFLPALQGNLVARDAPNVLSVLLFPSERCYCVNVVTVDDDETMQQLAGRMAEHFFKLLHGPFKPFDEKERAELLRTLCFSTEMQYVHKNARALDVATQSRHVVLSTLSLDELQHSRGHLTGSASSSLRDFFNSERQPVSEDDLAG